MISSNWITGEFSIELESQTKIISALWPQILIRPFHDQLNFGAELIPTKDILFFVNNHITRFICV